MVHVLDATGAVHVRHQALQLDAYWQFGITSVRQRLDVGVCGRSCALVGITVVWADAKRSRQVPHKIGFVIGVRSSVL
ncbi:unnamed protein product [Toxocara canis]|uniref:Transposase n=1 Tax=Toxocara canis TaxID=6265 RepID=A0A183TUW3_TOXCA|nr:unnamed protein product [Toxocara canis]